MQNLTQKLFNDVFTIVFLSKLLIFVVPYFKGKLVTCKKSDISHYFVCNTYLTETSTIT